MIGCWEFSTNILRALSVSRVPSIVSTKVSIFWEKSKRGFNVVCPKHPERHRSISFQLTLCGACVRALLSTTFCMICNLFAYNRQSVVTTWYFIVLVSDHILIDCTIFVGRMLRRNCCSFTGVCRRVVVAYIYDAFIVRLHASTQTCLFSK